MEILLLLIVQKPRRDVNFDTVLSIYFRTLEILAELLRAEGARVESHTLENLVTSRSQNFWLSRDCPSVRPFRTPRTIP